MPLPTPGEIWEDARKRSRKPRGAIEIEGRWVWLRGAYAVKYKTLKSLEEAREREAIRVEKFNPRMAQRLREMRMIEWLRYGGAISRVEPITKSE